LYEQQRIASYLGKNLKKKKKNPFLMQKLRQRGDFFI